MVKGPKPRLEITFRRGAAIAVVAALGVTLAACSSGPSSSTSAGSAAGSGASADTSNSLLSSIKKSGALRVGFAPAQPNSFISTSNGQWEGIYVSLMQDWAKQLNVKFEPVSTTFGNMIAGLQSNQFDVASNLNKTPQRESSVGFTEPLLTDIGAAAFNSTLHKWTSWSQLDQPSTTMCVVQGSGEDEALTASNPKAKLLRLGSETDCRVALQSGRANAFYDDWLAQGPFAKQIPNTKVLFPPTELSAAGIGFAVAKQYDGGPAVAALNKEIASFRASGKLAQAENQYGAVDPVSYAVGAVPSYVTSLEAAVYPGSK